MMWVHVHSQKNTVWGLVQGFSLVYYVSIHKRSMYRYYSIRDHKKHNFSATSECTFKPLRLIQALTLTSSVLGVFPLASNRRPLSKIPWRTVESGRHVSARNSSDPRRLVSPYHALVLCCVVVGYLGVDGRDLSQQLFRVNWEMSAVTDNIDVKSVGVLSARRLLSLVRTDGFQ